LEADLLQKLGSRKITKAQLFQVVEEDFSLVPLLLEGTSSTKATVRYGCGSVLMNLSEKQPYKLYLYMDKFVGLLDSEYRILTWNALAIIANLTGVDANNKFDAIFDKYYGFLFNEYMVTVANALAIQLKSPQTNHISPTKSPRSCSKPKTFKPHRT
jgi:hypothetical protein